MQVVLGIGKEYYCKDSKVYGSYSSYDVELILLHDLQTTISLGVGDIDNLINKEKNKR